MTIQRERSPVRKERLEKSRKLHEQQQTIPHNDHGQYTFDGRFERNDELIRLRNEHRKKMGQD